MTQAPTMLANPAPVDRPQACDVQTQGLGKSIDGRLILDNITFTAQRCAITALLGPNGAGKSTLLHILATLTAHTTGTLTLFGKPVARRTADLRARIGMIGHQPMLYRDLTAMENLVFFGKLHGVANPRNRAKELLDRVALAHRSDDPAGTFSRGMVQRLSIARALVHEPTLLLADEPFAGLDLPSTYTIEALLTQLADEGATVVMTNHDVAQSLRLAKRVVVLRKGTVAWTGEADMGELERVQREILGT
ncbi:MAG: ATP-binding cassette domain-containing protein [Phycisphaera sp.]|nr:ATP-binding cassette domain-containing protein [Phycisphaera sp.]